MANRNLVCKLLPLVWCVAVVPARARAQVIWTRTASLSGRIGAGMAYDSARDRLVLFGGQAIPGQTLGDTWESAGRGWMQQTPTVSPAVRSHHCMAYDPLRGRVVLFGGRSFVGGTRILNDTWEWDGVAWTERQPAHRPPSRDNSAMAWDGSTGRLLLFGGHADQGGGFYYYSADLWAWDGTDWTQLQSATRPVARQSHAMAWDVGRQRLVVYGGAILNGGSTPANDTWEWDGTNWTQRFPVASPPGLQGHVMAWRASAGQVVLFGGYAFPSRRNDTWQWDGTTWSQLATSTPLPAVREDHCAAWDSQRGTLVVFGGWDDALHILGDTWRLDAAAQWRVGVANGTPPSRGQAAMAADAVQRRLVLFGGLQLAFQALGDTWESDGAEWVLRTPVTSPPPRAGHAMTTDPATGRVLLFGGGWGTTNFGLADTWQWSGTTWTQLNPAVAPPPRYLSAMCENPGDHGVVLFGGQDSSFQYGDTWVWSGATGTWQQRLPAHQPPARGRHGMAYDPRRNRVLLFGGMDPLGDTWEWDGTDWAQRFPTTVPSARAFPAMSYDPERGRVVLFGGNTFTDTWEWDGTDWIRRTPLQGPPAGSAVMAFDPDRRRCVLVTGVQTWEYGSVYPASLAPFGSGCAGTLGVPTLLGRDGSKPWLADRFDLEIRGVPSGQIALVLLGLSRTSWLGTVALPLDLGAAGMPGCALRAAPELIELAATAGTVATWSALLPADPSLRGTALFAQSLVSDPGANVAGAVLSNGVEGRFGSR